MGAGLQGRGGDRTAEQCRDHGASQARLKAQLISGPVLGEKNEWCHCVHCSTYRQLPVYLVVALQLFRCKLGMETKPLCTHQKEISAAPLWASRVTALCVGTLLPMLLSPTPCLQPQRLLGTPHPMRPSPQARKWDLGRHAAPASPSVASALRAPRVLAVPANFCCTYAALVFLPE